jgi:hypothetical protein
MLAYASDGKPSRSSYKKEEILVVYESEEGRMPP